MILKLFQGDIVTKIRIETDKAAAVVNTIGSRQDSDRTPVATIRAAQAADTPRRKRVPLTRLNAEQVKEIRDNWDATVKACSTKNAAAEQLAKIYNCSAKNIYAIIYRYSWANV
jgi:hypothetical protein